MREYHTGRALEMIFLGALRDGQTHNLQDIYRVIEESNILNDADRKLIPTGSGYKKLQRLGISIESVTPDELADLVERHEISSEIRFRNSIRFSKRYLIDKGDITSPARNTVVITAAGKARLASAVPTEAPSTNTPFQYPALCANVA